MSILDIGFLSGDYLQSLEVASPLIEDILQKTGLAEEDHVKLVRAGYSPKQYLGLTDAEMEGLFRLGYQTLQAGDPERAKAVFLKLCQLDPLDARFPYAIAVTVQVQGKFDVAAKLYLIALALDATRVDIYVRLGECLLAAREYDEAREVLAIAMSLSGEGDEEAKMQAEALLARMPETDLKH
jgi:tetratricopeptide (TPR) repeat protein